MTTQKNFDLTGLEQDVFEIDSFFENPETLIEQPIEEESEEFENSDFAEESEEFKEPEKPLIIMDAVIDTEYTDDYPLSAQLLINCNILGYGLLFLKFMCLDSSYEYLLTKDEILNYSQQGIQIYFVSLKENKDTNFLVDKLHIEFHKIGLNIFDFKIKCYVWLYYSAKDLNIWFGPENMRLFYLGVCSRISQRRSFSGHLSFNNYRNIIFILKDLCGLDKSGLKNMALAYGVPINQKDVLNEYKAKMNVALTEKTHTFIAYAMNDVEVTFKISCSIVKTFNKILIELFPNIKSEELFDRYKMPLTIGAIVYRIFLKFIKYDIFQNNDLFIISCSKRGILNPMNKNYMVNKDSLFELSKLENLTDLQKVKDLNPSLFKKMQELKEPQSFKYSCFQFSSNKFLMERIQNTSLLSATMVSGGRTVNERPLEYYFEEGADIDISGAYASVLKDLEFPIGMPTIITYSFNEKINMTLGNFMTKHKSELINNLYKITVTGELSFEQDLIFSRIVDTNNYQKYVDKYDPESSSTFDVNKPFILLRKQINEGVITSSIWEVINKVATNKELHEFLNLKVTNAIYWPASKKVNTIQDLSLIYLKDKEELKFDIKNSVLMDNRSRNWTSLPLKPFVEKLIEKRKFYKKLKTSEGDAIQNTLKLILNTIYGLLCSPHFSINNVVLADQITSKIRVGAWQMSKALCTFLSITDGGPFCLNQVASFKENIKIIKKPGFKQLSSFYILKENKSIEIKPLNNINWHQNFKNKNFQPIDDIATEHVSVFWRHYDLKFPFNLEQKTFILKGSYMLKAHYAFINYDFNKKEFILKPLIKIRGFRELPEAELKYQHVMKDLLLFMLDKENQDGIFEIPNEGIYYSNKLLKIANWKQSLIKRENSKILYSSLGEEVLPGDKVVKTHIFKLNNTHFYLNKIEDYKKRTNRTTKKNIALFERYLNTLGIKKMIQRMDLDLLKPVKNKKKFD